MSDVSPRQKDVQKLKNKTLLFMAFGRVSFLLEKKMLLFLDSALWPYPCFMTGTTTATPASSTGGGSLLGGLLGSQTTTPASTAAVAAATSAAGTTAASGFTGFGATTTSAGTTGTSRFVQTTEGKDGVERCTVVINTIFYSFYSLRLVF